MHLFDAGHALLRRQRDRRRRAAARRRPRAGRPHARHVDRVTACFFGEGAVAEGEFHESMNLAALWRLPVLFCCENNLYAMGTALERSESETDLALKAAAYEMAAWAVDGMDVLAVEDAARRAVRQRSATAAGPCFLELRTYRFRAHSMYDPELLPRPRRRSSDWKQRDPIDAARRAPARAEGVLDDDELGRARAPTSPPRSTRAVAVRRGRHARAGRGPHRASSTPRRAATDAMTQTTYREAMRDGAARRAASATSACSSWARTSAATAAASPSATACSRSSGPSAIRDTPLSESAFVGAGIGAALGGMRPIVEIMTVNFSLLALDQIVNNAATLLAHVGRPVPRAARDPHDDRRRPPARRPALAQPRGLVRPHARPPGARPGHARGRPRHALDRRSPTPIRC